MRVLFLGLGGIGQRHLRNLRRLVPDCAIAAVRRRGRTFEITPELKADRSVNIVEKYGISLYPDIAQAVADFVPDCAVVATPSSAHVALTLELIRADVPVLLEKPISHDETGVDDLAHAVERSGVAVMVGYMLRFHPAVAKLRDLVRKEALGRIYGAHIVAHTFMPAWHEYEGVDEFYAGRADLGGGVVMTSIHLIDLMQWIFGTPRRVMCLGGRCSSQPIDVEDSVAGLFDYDRDGRPAPVTLNLSFVQRPMKNTITVMCEKGVMAWDLAAGATVVDNAANGDRQEFAFAEVSWNDLFVAEMRHFLDCVATRAMPEVSLSDAIGGHRVALAMKRSLTTGEIARV